MTRASVRAVEGRVWRGVRSAAALAAAGVLLTGCRTPAGMTKMKEEGAKVKYVASLDRVVFFGRTSGPNMLHTEMRKVRRQTPDSGGAYTFYGGMYSWISPQAAWVDEEGERRSWPPDAAADRGPALVRKISEELIEAEGPTTRSGLRERKRFAVRSATELDVQHALINESQESKSGGVWTVTAVSPKALIAVPRSPEGVRFGDEGQEELWNAITEQEGNWTVIDTGAKGWWTKESGGELKAFIDSPPMIAVWRRGNWFLRVGERDDASWEGLRSAGEGAVEVYLNFGLKLFEAELLGAIHEIEPGGERTFQERWVIIPSRDQKTEVLDEAVKRIWGEWEEERQHGGGWIWLLDGEHRRRFMLEGGEGGGEMSINDDGSITIEIEEAPADFGSSADQAPEEEELLEVPEPGEEDER